MAAVNTMVVGKKSGKRTLAGVMDDEIAAKRKRQEQAAAAAELARGVSAFPPGVGVDIATPRVPTTSKFFYAAQRSVSDPRGDRGWSRVVAGTPNHARRGHGHDHDSSQQPVAGSSSGLSQHEKEKENVQPEADEMLFANVVEDVEMGSPDAITQEDGYISPTESMAQWDSPNISSPVRPGVARAGGRRRDEAEGPNDWDDEDLYDADVLSSSPVARTRRRSPVVVERVVTRALPLRPVLNTSFSQRDRARSRSRTRRKSLGDSGEEGPAGRDGPDLRRVFDDYDDIQDWDEITSGGEDCEPEDDVVHDFVEEDVMFSTASSTPGPVTPATDHDDIGCEGESPAVLFDEGSSEELEGDHSHDGAASQAARNAKVAHGWWEKWARSGPSASGRGANAAAATGGSDRVRFSLPSILLAR